MVIKRLNKPVLLIRDPVEDMEPATKQYADDLAFTGGGATELDQLTDVDVATTPPTDGQALLFDDANDTWKPGTVATGGSDLADTIEGVSNPGGNIDVVGTGGISVTGDNTANTITIDGAGVSGGAGVFVQVARQATQSINSATDTNISWDTEVVDDAANFFSAGADDRITIQTNGNYLVRTSALFQSNATGIRGISIKVNGTTVATDIVQATLDNFGRAIVNYMGQFVATDYIQVHVYQDSGSAKTFGGNVNTSLPRPTLTLASVG